jgi:hypothetical protein
MSNDGAYLQKPHRNEALEMRLPFFRYQSLTVDCRKIAKDCLQYLLNLNDQ